MKYSTAYFNTSQVYKYPRPKEKGDSSPQYPIRKTKCTWGVSDVGDSHRALGTKLLEEWEGGGQFTQRWWQQEDATALQARSKGESGVARVHPPPPPPWEACGPPSHWHPEPTPLGQSQTQQCSSPSFLTQSETSIHPYPVFVRRGSQEKK